MFYTGMCGAHGLLEMRLFKDFKSHPDGFTHDLTLLKNSELATRISFTLAINTALVSGSQVIYLCFLIIVSDNAQTSVFEQTWQNMNNITPLGFTFHRFAALLVVAVSIMELFNVLPLVLKKLKLFHSSMDPGLAGEDDIVEGRAFLSRVESNLKTRGLNVSMILHQGESFRPQVELHPFLRRVFRKDLVQKATLATDPQLPDDIEQERKDEEIGRKKSTVTSQHTSVPVKHSVSSPRSKLISSQLSADIPEPSQTQEEKIENFEVESIRSNNTQTTRATSRKNKKQSVLSQKLL
jgi:hypothetical protein